MPKAGARARCTSTRRTGCRLEKGRRPSTATMAGANRPQDHHCTRDSSVALPKSWLTVISGSTATSPTAVQKQAPSAIDLGQEPRVGSAIVRSVLMRLLRCAVGGPDVTQDLP